MTQRFVGRVAVVTGAASGIGRAAAERLHTEGAMVAVLDLDGAAARAVAETLDGDQERSLAVTCDVRDTDSATAAVEAAADRFGGVDVLVNSAGIVRYGEVTDVSDQDWEAVVDTNLTGAFRMMRAVVPHLRARGRGAIVSVASNQAYASQRSVAAYVASKGGLVALTKAVALDHADEGIRVNAVAPGSTRTAMLETAAARFAPEDPDRAIRDWGHALPIGRVIEPGEVAAVIAFLASDESSAVTGATYLCDGALSAALRI